MNNKITYAKTIRNADGGLFSEEFDDIYFSKEDGFQESLHVFFRNNNLPERFTTEQDFRILETGFGTGLNFLIAVNLWQKNNIFKNKLHFVSVEKYPLSKKDMQYAWQFFPAELTTNEDIFFKQYKNLTVGLNILEFKGVELSLFVGDIQEFLPQIKTKIGKVDSWFLDGFSPSKNQEMWQKDLFISMKNNTKQKGTFATFSASGFVRRGLIEQGFNVKKVKGFGKKREMLSGILNS